MNGDSATLRSTIVRIYEAARDRGESRCDAFCRAVTLYRLQHPGKPINVAGTEVARLLLAAARAEVGAGPGSAASPRAPDMEYAEST